MTFTNEQIKALDNPYQELIVADKLVEHQEQLDRLSAQEKKEMAIKLVQDCPEKELTRLGHAIKALKAPAASEESFQYIVNQVWEIRKRIIALKDSRNKKPHNLLLDPEFNVDLFAEFNDFSLQLLDGNEDIIAQKLALSTPTEQRSNLVRNVQNAFPDSQFVTVVSSTFAFRRALDVLLGDEPYKFFINGEFKSNVNSYLKYAELLALIDGKDEAIAEQLAKTPEIKRCLVLDHMQLIFPGSILLEKTQKAFNAPIKSIVHSSMFVPAKEAAEPKKDQAHTGLSL